MNITIDKVMTPGNSIKYRILSGGAKYFGPSPEAVLGDFMMQYANEIGAAISIDSITVSDKPIYENGV
jgi:hypothetical protein